MAFVHNTEVRCPHCGKTHLLQVYGSINSSEDPSLAAQAGDGSLFIWECPGCGQRNLLKSELLYHDPDRKFMIWLLPEGSLDAAVAPGLENRIAEIATHLDGYVLRRVPDVSSFIEKVGIFQAGLDDMVMEMCKYVTKMELSEKAGAKSDAIMAAPFRFFRLQGADNEMVLSFPMDGAMQGVNVGFNVYEDCRGILGRNPSVAESVEGFAKIDADWLSRFFR